MPSLQLGTLQWIGYVGNPESNVKFGATLFVSHQNYPPMKKAKLKISDFDHFVINRLSLIEIKGGDHGNGNGIPPDGSVRTRYGQ